jgi:thiol-disulfide isomerase/thioredoxin
MKIRKISGIVLLVLMVIPLSLTFIDVSSIEDNTTVNNFTTEVVENGRPAMDFNLKEIASDVNYTFSGDFAGKVVMIDFFATWCGPCIAAMPLLSQIYTNYLGEPNFVLISLSLDDPAINETTLEDFIDNNNMDWYVFHDYTEDLGYGYFIEYIPTLYIFTKTHYLYYSEVGMSATSHLIDIIDDLLAFSDTTDPSIGTLDLSESSISILDNDFSATCAFTETNLQSVKFELEIGDNIEVANYWADETNPVVHDFLPNIQHIYDATAAGYENATVTVTVNDFNNNYATASSNISLTALTDLGAPNATINQVTHEKRSIGYDIFVNATITEDLLLYSKVVEIWAGPTLLETADLVHDTGDFYIAEFKFLPVAEGQELTIKVIAEDVASNIDTDQVTHVLAPTNTGGITLPVIIGIFILGNILLVPIVVRRKK